MKESEALYLKITKIEDGWDVFSLAARGNISSGADDDDAARLVWLKLLSC